MSHPLPDLQKGSSPLTRGKPPVPFWSPQMSGLIPAHAGKTSRLYRPTGMRRAHPRSRGENPGPQPRRRLPTGSSPLTRGKRPTRRTRRPQGGLIPAHAGKTRCFAATSCTTSAHPRSRGENQDENVINLSKQGSSPLTRGKQNPGARKGPLRGLIPAHAGKTRKYLRWNYPRAAHPRSRGENTL